MSPGLRFIQPSFRSGSGGHLRRGSLLPTFPGSGGRAGGLVEQLGGALSDELPLLQSAADRQFTRNTEPIANMRGLIGRSGEFTATGEATASSLDQMAQAQRDEFEAGVRDTMSRFDTTYADDVTAAIAGIRESYQPTLQAIRNGMNPDGTLMTPAQQKDAMFALQRQVGSQVQEVVTQMASSYNQARASLAAGFSGQRLSSQQTAASLAQTAASIRNAAQAAALQFEASGNQVMADLIYRNPESIVSRFQGLLALAGVATAPYAWSQRAVPA